MKTGLRVGVLALLVLGVACADFDKAEQSFCERNPDRCGGDGGSTPSFSQLAFTTDPQTVQAGHCSAVTTVQLRDSHGAPVNVTADTAVALSMTPADGFQFFTDASCTGTPVTAVSLHANSSTASFYFLGTRAGAATLSASVGSLSGTQGVTISPIPAAALALTLPTSPVPAGTCTGGTVQVQDANGSNTQVGSDTSVSLEAAPPANLAFYSDAACTVPATSVLVRAKEGSATFYFQGQDLGDTTVTASASGLTQASQTVQLAPGTGNRLVFTSSARTMTAGACSQVVQVQSQDAQGSAAPVTAATTVALAASPSTGFKFYSDSGCTTEVTSTNIASGASTTGFYFKGTTAGTVAVTASAPSFTRATQNETITPAALSKVVFSTPARTTVAGACSAIISVQSADTYNNASPVPTNMAINLSQAGTPSDANFRFYADANCISGITSTAIPAGQTTASFYYRPEKARTVTLTATTASFGNSSQDNTVTPASPSSLTFSSTTPAQTQLAGTCALRTVESRDAFGNLTADALTLTLGPSPQAEFFTDANCTSSVSSVPITAGNSSASFYFKGYTGGINANGTVTLTASAPGASTASQTETVIPTVRTGTCALPGSTRSILCTITPALSNGNKVLLVFQATSQNTDSTSANVQCRLYSLTQVLCERGNTGITPVNIRWSAAEFPNGVVAQNFGQNCLADTTPITLPTNVTASQSFLFVSGERSVTGQGLSVPRLAELTAPNQVQIRKTAGAGCSPADASDLQVIDYTGASVQRGLTSMVANSASTQVTLPSGVVLDRSILLYSYIYDSTTTKICDRLVRGELTNSGTKVTFTRGDGDTSANCTAPNITSISYEVVQFPVGTFVQQITRQLGAGAASATITLPTAVDASRTIVIAGGQWSSGQVHGESSYSGGELISEGRAQAALSTDGTTLTLNRESTNGSATFTVYVIQLKP